MTLASTLDSIPGKYLIRPASQRPATSAGKYQAIVESPVSYGFLAYRFFVKDKTNISDFDVVHAMQNATIVKSKPRRTSTFADAAPPVSSEVLNGSTLEVLARIAPFNPPATAKERKRVNKILTRAGISEGVYTSPKGANLTAASALANSTLASALASVSGTQSLGNGWVSWFPTTIGNYSDDYLGRRYIADHLYAALTPDVARYPTYTKDTIGENQNLEVGVKEAYLMTFYSKPPLVQSGFWSVTAYDGQQHLIPNGLNRYSLGTASGMTYPDGRLIYPLSAGSQQDDDGTFRVLLQPAGLYPPANWTSNWLPVPEGGGQFSIRLRWYGPSEGLDKYEYPVVEKIAALVQ